DDGYRNAVRIKRNDSLSGAVDRERWSKASADEIELLRQRTLSGVERQEFEEATEVVIHLDVAFAGWIDSDAESRRPLIGEAVSVAITRNRVRAADHSFLFRSQTQERGDVFVYAPRVLNVTGVVVSARVEGWWTKLTTENLQRHRHEVTAHVVQRTQRAGVRLCTQPELN